MSGFETNYPHKKFLLIFVELGSYEASFELQYDTLCEAEMELRRLIESHGSFYATISEVKLCFSLEEGSNRQEMKRRGK